MVYDRWEQPGTTGRGHESTQFVGRPRHLLGIPSLLPSRRPKHGLRRRAATLRMLEHVRPNCWPCATMPTQTGTSSVPPLCSSLVRMGEGSPHAPHKVILYQSAWACTFYPCNNTEFEDEPCADPHLKRQALLCHRSQLTLATHDGFGNSLLHRGNLISEKRWYVPPSTFRNLPMCLPNLRRRTQVLPDIFEYVLEVTSLLLRDTGARIISHRKHAAAAVRSFATIFGKTIARAGAKSMSFQHIKLPLHPVTHVRKQQYIFDADGLRVSSGVIVLDFYFLSPYEEVSHHPVIYILHCATFYLKKERLFDR